MKPPIVDLEAWSPSLEQWDQRRSALREGLSLRLGHLPLLGSRVGGDILKEESHALGWAQKIKIDNGTPHGMPAWFLSPRDGSNPGPAILWLHWHGGEYAVGKQEIFEDLHTPESPVQCFLRMGWSVLCADAYGFGERNGRDQESGGDFDQEGEHTLFKTFLWQGSSLWGRMLWDDRLAFHYLCNRPEVNAKQVIAVGVSMGATRAQWLLAFEDALAGAISMACAVRYRHLLAQNGLKHHGMYFFVPGLVEYCDLELILALGAPRPHLLLNGQADSLSPTSGIRKAVNLASQIYALYGQESALDSVLLEKVKHEVNPSMWDAMKTWCGRAFQGC